MKDEILQIAYSLEKGRIDEETAKQELCVLLGVSECYSPKDRLDTLEKERDELLKKEHSAGLMMEVGRKLGAMQEIERIFNFR